MNPTQKEKRPSKITWGILGALFGFAFPALALLIRSNQAGHGGNPELFNNDPLLAIICTAPIFLGIFAYIGGAENDRVRQIRKNLEISNIHASKMATLGEMAGGIAHEINNPLSVISFKTELVRIRLKESSITPPEAAGKILHDLLTIDHTVDRIAKIIRGLRTFSRDVDHDQMELFKIHDMIEDSLSLCMEKMKAHSVDLRIKEESNRDLAVEGRAVQLSQVILNMLNNSMDAIESLPEKWIELNVSQIKTGVRISITDSGSGIPKDIISKIMQPFFTTKEQGRGTGLGLSISKGIVDDHHGRIYYDETSKHTRFIVELPFKQPVQPIK